MYSQTPPNPSQPHSHSVPKAPHHVFLFNTLLRHMVSIRQPTHTLHLYTIRAPTYLRVNCRKQKKADASAPALRLSHSARISSGPIGSYFPSFISKITVPDSNARTVCHCPAGIFTATTGPLGVSSILSVHIRSSSS